MAYRWSEARQRYVYDSGKIVPQATVNQALDRAIASAADRMVAISQQLQTGDITLAQWQGRMAAEMKLLHTGAAALGRGGWSQMTQSDWGWTGWILRRQYNYLQRFAQDIATGHQPLDGRLLARTTMYADAARGTQRQMQRRNAQGHGHTEERNRLGAAEHHCSECPDLSSRGWVPIGSLPPPGSRQCLSRCHCSLQTRDAA